MQRLWGGKVFLRYHSFFIAHLLSGGRTKEASVLEVHVQPLHCLASRETVFIHMNLQTLFMSRHTSPEARDDLLPLDRKKMSAIAA